MNLKPEIGQRVKWIIDNEGKYFFWVPIAAFLVGGAAAYLYWISKKLGKRKFID
jgi:glycerol uptake facilitator-like aquaporin